MPWQISVHRHHDPDRWDEDWREWITPPPRRQDVDDWPVHATVATASEAGRIVRELRNQGHDSVSMTVARVASMPEPELEPAFRLTGEPAPRRRGRMAK